jgi:hypothetical protein
MSDDGLGWEDQDFDDFLVEEVIYFELIFNRKNQNL